MCIPPLKLNPFNAGISKEIGIPEIKKAIKGNKINTEKLIQKTGYCAPVKSCFFLAYFHIFLNMGVHGPTGPEFSFFDCCDIF